jgi:hypothetical protein
VIAIRDLRSAISVNHISCIEYLTSNVVFFEHAWPLESRDLHGQSLPDAEVARFPGDLVAELE